MVKPLSNNLSPPTPIKTALFAQAVNVQAALPEGLAEALSKTFGSAPLEGAVFALKSEKKDKKTFFVLIVDKSGTQPFTYRMPEQKLEKGVIGPQAEAVHAFIWKKAQSERTPEEISADEADKKQQKKQQKEQLKNNSASDERGVINSFFNHIVQKANGLESDGTRKDGGYKSVDTSDIIFVGNLPPPEQPKL